MKVLGFTDWPEISDSGTLINGYDTDITLIKSVRSCQMRKITEKIVKIDAFLAEILKKNRWSKIPN